MPASIVRISYLFLLCAVLAPIRVRAQPVVIAWSAADADLEAIAAHAREAIDLHGASSTEPRAAIDARSTEPASIPPDVLERWSSLARQAVRSLAHGDHDAAAAALAEVREISETFLVDLNRDDARAVRLLDACLFDVRARLEAHDEQAAERAIACRRLAPHVVPSPFLHPPEVLVLFEAASANASLHVESMPSGCAVRVNGVAMGTTPRDVDALIAGDYALQVECDAAPGRVHTVTTETSVRVEARLEAIVRTEPVLRLAYATAADADAHRVEDALALGALLSARETWLVSPEGDVRVDEPIAIRASASAPSDGRADWEIGTGIGLGVLGLGAIVTSGALISVGEGYGRLATQPLPTDPDYLARRAQWTSWEMPALAMGWIGGALFTSALPLLLPREPGVPEWSFWIGGVGVAVIGAGLALALAPSRCGNERPSASCVDGNALADAGSTIASLGVPLLSVPIVYWLRDVLGGTPPITPSVSASPSGASVGVEGAW